MIKNLYLTRPNLYRGSAPDSQDVSFINDKLNISKIISLDEYSAEKIDKVCKKLDIDHVKINLHAGKINSLKHLLKYNLNDLVNPKVGTFVHCLHGRDRTGLFIALVRCLLDNWDCRQAIKEAKQIGFGIDLDFPVEKFYMKLIHRACKHHQDNNHAYDIVSNVQDLDTFYRDQTFDPYIPSWAPYADKSVRKYPEAFVNSMEYEGQYPTREEYRLSGINMEDDGIDHIPLVGIYDQNTQITNVIGPSMVGGGFV